MDCIQHIENGIKKARIGAVSTDLDDLAEIERYEASITSVANRMRRQAAEDAEHQLEELFAAGYDADGVNPIAIAEYDGHRIRQLTAQDERLVADVIRSWTERDAIDGGAPLCELFD